MLQNKIKKVNYSNGVSDMSEKLEKSRFSREIVKMNLYVILDSFDKFLSLSDSNRDLFISPENYNVFSDLFYSVDQNGSRISSEDVHNLDDWMYAIQKIHVISSLFREHKGFLKHYFSINKVELASLIREIRAVLTKLENSPVRENHDRVSSVESSGLNNNSISRTQKSLIELIKEDVKIHGMFLEEKIDEIDFDQYKDYILFSFYGDKLEINLSPLNQAFGDFLLSQGEDEISAIGSFDLEYIKEDNDSDNEFEGGYEFTAVILEDVQDEIIVTSKNNPKINLAPDSINSCDSGMSLGDFFYKDSELVGFPFVHIETSSAPADMAGIIMLREEVSKLDLENDFCFLTASDSIVGVKYKNEEYRFALGNIGEVQYMDSYLITINSFRKLTEF